MHFMHRSRFGFKVALCAGTLVGLPFHALAQGWTNLTPPPGAQVFYVSTSGNDSNAGSQSSPFRTVRRGYSALRAGQPDQVLLRCGDTFSEDVDLTKGSGSMNSYMVIGSYGTGPRPKIRSSQTPLNGGSRSVRGIAIVDLDLAPSGTPVMGNNGIWFGDGWSHVLIEGCLVSGYPVNIASHATSGGRIDDLRIRRNVIVDSYGLVSGHSQNLFLGEQFGLVVEDNILDRAGRTGEQTIFRHNVYIHDNNAGTATFVGNITARACATGVQQRPGGTSKNNLLIQNPIGHTWGGNGTFSYNVAIDGRDINGAEPRGIAYSLSNGGTVEYNIAAYQQTGTANITAFTMEGFDSGTFRGNYVYDWKAPGGEGWATSLQWEGGSGSVNVTGNKFIMPNFGMMSRHESRPLSSEFSYSANTYYTSTPPGGIGGYLHFAISSGVGRDWSSWRSQAGESGSTFLGSAPANPNATISAYLQSVGVNPGSDPVDTFMNEARQQSRQNWRPQFTAAAFNDWARARVGLPLLGGGNPPPNCYANCDQSTSAPVLTGNDFQCFLNGFAAGQSSADCDGVGGLTGNDFQCFLNAYAAGCS
jgi:hypothetical protein